MNKLRSYDGSRDSGSNVPTQAIKSRLVTVGAALLCVCAVFLASSSPVMAQAGKLDPKFGNNGIFLTNFNFCCTSPIENVVALQSDGKIVLGGQVGSTSGPQGALVRVTTAGALDSSFGSGGLVTSNFNNTIGADVVGLAIQTDGKILASANGTIRGGFELGRFNKDGSVDTTFGTNGFANAPPVNFAGALALQADGKILVLGSVANAFTSGGALVRFDSTGVVDATFGTNGIAPLLAGGSALTLQSDGKILVSTGAGSFGPSTGSVTRYNADGSVDRSFGISGQAASLAGPSALAVQSNGEIVAVGSLATAPVQGETPTGFGVIRFNASGSVDTTFGTQGGTASAFPGTIQGTAKGVALQLNGDIVLGGEAGNVNPTTTTFALARYTTNGSLDPMFGNGGLITTNFNNSPVNSISGVVIQKDGKIVAAGNAEGQFAVARYLAQ